jgi:hypothetical protein
MARSFNGTSQYAQYAGAVVTGYPFTLAAWVKPGVNGLENDFVLSLSDVSETAVYQAIILGGGTVGDEGKVLAVSRNTTLAAAKTSAAMSAGTWNHAAGVFSSATSRAAYLNGGNKGTETTNITFAAGIDTTAIGRLSRPTPAAYFHGSCAEAGVWAAALSDEEIAALAAGLSPLQVRPQSLVAYWPLFARATNEEDWVGGNTLAVTGATAADHPRIIYPAWPEIILPAAGGASPTAVSDTIDVRWNIRSLISDSLDTRWNISASVSDAATLQWDLRAPVSDTITAQWHIRSVVSDSIDLRWNLRKAIADTLEAQWDILQTGLSAVGDTLDTRWHIRQLANDTVEPRWDIRNTVSDASDLRWHIANAVADTVEIQWSVRNLAADDITLQWDSIGVVGDAVTLQWSITGSGVFVPVNVVIMAERTFTYKIPTRVQ